MSAYLKRRTFLPQKCGQQYLKAVSRLAEVIRRASFRQTEARQQIKSNAVSVGSEKVTDPNATISVEQFGTDGLMLQKGKKGFRRLMLK